MVANGRVYEQYARILSTEERQQMQQLNPDVGR